MRKIMLLTLIALLFGCVSKDSQHVRRGGVFIDGNRVCFSVNKNQVLSHYEFSAIGKVYSSLLSGRSKHLSYPDSCFMLPLENGVIYRANYIVDNENYYNVFIKDNTGHVIYLWSGIDCPYLSTVPW